MSLACVPGFPVNHPRIIRSSEDEIKELVKDRKVGIIFSTACWRGYIGSWSIRRGKLYLTKLQGCFRPNGKEAIIADWFTGALHIPQGEVLDYIHMAFDTVYEQELILTVAQGLVTDTEVVPSAHRIRMSDLIDLGDGL